MLGALAAVGPFAIVEAIYGLYVAASHCVACM